MRLALLAALPFLAGCARAPLATGGAATAGATPATTPASILPPAGNPAIGGVALPVDQSIVDDLAAAPGLSQFFNLVALAGMSDALRAPGPFTVFAPTAPAFGRLQPGTIEALSKPENRAALIKLIGLHIVAERLGGVDIMRRIAAGGGRATLTSVAGEPLTATMTGGVVTLADGGGNKSYIETADIRAANGMIHVVNGVLVPRLN